MAVRHMVVTKINCLYTLKKIVELGQWRIYGGGQWVDPTLPCGECPPFWGSPSIGAVRPIIFVLYNSIPDTNYRRAK